MKGDSCFLCVCVSCACRGEQTDRHREADGWSSGVQQVEIPFSRPLLFVSTAGPSQRLELFLFFSFSGFLFSFFNQLRAAQRCEQRVLTVQSTRYQLCQDSYHFSLYHPCDPLLHDPAQHLTSNSVFILGKGFSGRPERRSRPRIKIRNLPKEDHPCGLDRAHLEYVKGVWRWYFDWH